MFKWLKNIFKNKECHTIWGIRLCSHDEVLYKNVITIFLGTYIKSFILPFNIIKPIVDYHVYKKDIDDKDTDDIMATAYSVNVYGITYLPNLGCFELNWNYADDSYVNIIKHKGFSKYIYLFWKNQKRIKTMLLNLDMSAFSDITDSTEANIEYVTNMQPRFYISVKYLPDDIQLIAECRAVRRTYAYGNSWLTRKIMRLFKKPYIVTTIEIDVPELSYSASIMVNPYEDMIDTFKRFCRAHKYEFISVVEKG